MTCLVFVTSASLQPCVVAWPPSHGGSRDACSGLVLSLQSQPPHLCLGGGWGGLQKWLPHLTRGGVGQQPLRMHFSKWSRTIAAYCMMAGSAFLTSCWILLSLW